MASGAQKLSLPSQSSTNKTPQMLLDLLPFRPKYLSTVLHSLLFWKRLERIGWVGHSTEHFARWWWNQRKKLKKRNWFAQNLSSATIATTSKCSRTNRFHRPLPFLHHSVALMWLLFPRHLAPLRTNCELLANHCSVSEHLNGWEMTIIRISMSLEHIQPDPRVCLCQKSH